MALRNLARRVHRHAAYGPCMTVCGIACDLVDTAYAHDADRVNCSQCLAKSDTYKQEEK